MVGPWPRIFSSWDAADTLPDDLTSIIRRRRMTRKFSGGPTLREVLDVCDVARRAPSAGYSQGCHFLVLDGSDKDTFFEVSGAGTWFARRAPGVRDCTQIVLVLADPEAYTDRYSQADKIDRGLSTPESWACPYWLTDAAMAAQNLLLLCEDRRWGALLFGLFGNPRDTLGRFGVPDAIQCVGAIAIGHRSPEDRPSGSSTIRGRRSSNEVIHVGHWAAPSDDPAGFTSGNPEV